MVIQGGIFNERLRVSETEREHKDYLADPP